MFKEFNWSKIVHFQDDRLIKTEKSRGDQTVEIILATTALVTVVALFLR